MDANKLAQQIEVWRRDLIDFSRRNNLLNFSTRATHLTLTEPSPEQVLAHLLGRRSWKVFLPSLSDDEAGELEGQTAMDSMPAPTRAANEVLTDKADRGRLLATLRTLQRRSDQEFLDKGLRVLYLTIGSLKWSQQGDEWESPILLLPITLGKGGDGSYAFALNDEEDIAVNPALLEKLRDVFNLDLELEFDEDHPSQVLKSIENTAKKFPGWSVGSLARIGIHSFAKEVMYRDLSTNAGAVATSGLVKALAFGSESGGEFAFDSISDAELDIKYPPTTLRSILDADSTQRKAIIAAREGKSFVIDGPPGSGKSQTIANIISELIGQRKSVLFVSEKAAALEVVQNRLEGAGLASYLLPLHSQKVTRKAFAGMLMKAANERTRAGKRLTPQEVQSLTEVQKKLSAYAAAMNERRDPLGRSLYEIVGECVGLEDVPLAPIPTHSVDRSMTPTFFSEIAEAMQRLSFVWDVVTSPDSVAWRELNDPEKTNSERPRLASQIDVFLTNLDQVELGAAEVAEDAGLPQPTTFRELRALIKLADLTTGRPSVPVAWLTAEKLDQIRSEVKITTSRIEELRLAIETLEDRVPNWREIDEQVGDSASELIRDFSDRHGLPMDISSPLAELSNQAEVLRSAMANLQLAAEDAGRLEERFGEPSETLTIQRIGSLSAAAQLAASAHRPESLWFTATGIQAALDVIDLLQPIVNDYWARAQALDAYFDPEIRSFPIDQIFDEGSSEPVLGALSSRGRANRKALQPLVKGGKLNKEVRSQLKAVRDLQAIGREIEENNRNQDTLGSYYFRGVQTDFEVLTDALDVARQAVVSLGDADPERLADALGRAALDATETADRGRRIANAIAAFDELFTQSFGVAPDQVVPIDQLIYSTEGITALWTNVHGLLAPIDQAARPLSIADALEAATWRTSIGNALAALEADDLMIREQLGDLYQEVDTDLDAIDQALIWVSEVRGQLEEVPSPRLAQRLLDLGVPDSAQLRELVTALDQTSAALQSHFQQERAAALRDDLEIDLDSARDVVQLLSDQMEQIGDQVIFREEYDHLADQGLGEVLSFLLAQRVPAEQIQPTMKRAIYGAWIESVINSDKARLKPMEQKSRDSAVAAFRDNDRRLRLHAVAEVVEVADQARPKTMIGPMGLIIREASKKTRHMRIPDLISKTKDVVQDIAPCFMMSPLSVSTFLPPNLIFDTVIFDEASQILTSNAINCVYRSRQLIVAGDERQMPPSRGFEALAADDESDEYDEEEIEDFESLLHQANAGGFVNLGLRWHYRSRHESLITFSNVSFYDGKLITYPSPSATSDQLGVSFIHVPDGVYLRGGRRTNPIEAAKVVERVIHHADKNPDLTVGVVAFSVAQADEIENALEKALEERPDLADYFTADRLDGFFVKNLESVQGDERDIIIFSVGYGRDEHGKLTMNFGPVNRPKGWRRLNVAFTRARCRVELVSSIRAADLVPGQNESVNHLRRYFDYAERGMAALATDPAGTFGDAESPFEEAVIQRIRSWGYDVDSQVGQAGYRIDMAVRDPKHPGAHVLGIECDGAMYHSSLVARDRDRLRQEVLEGLGWHLYRIWGPTWYRSRNSAEADLKLAIKHAIESSEGGTKAASGRTARSSMPDAVVTEPVASAVHEVELGTTPEWVEPYFNTKDPAPKLPVGRTIANPEADAFIMAVIKREGPVDRTIIQRRFAIATGMNRTRKVQQFVDARLRMLEGDGQIKLWQPDAFALTGAALFRVRQPDPVDELTRRDSRTYPKTELMAAAFNLVDEVGTIDREELANVLVKNLFGLQRLTVQWRDRIDEVLEELDGKWFTTSPTQVTRLGARHPDGWKPWLDA